MNLTHLFQAHLPHIRTGIRKMVRNFGPPKKRIGFRRKPIPNFVRKQAL